MAVIPNTIASKALPLLLLVPLVFKSLDSKLRAILLAIFADNTGGLALVIIVILFSSFVEQIPLPSLAGKLYLSGLESDQLRYLEASGKLDEGTEVEYFEASDVLRESLEKAYAHAQAWIKERSHPRMVD